MTTPSRTDRTLLAKARIEGSRIARVSHGRLGIDPARTRAGSPARASSPAAR
jgi:hypothetical protein